MAEEKMFENRISSIEERDYYKVLGLSLKHLVLMLTVLGINALVVSIFTKGVIYLIFTNPILAIIWFIPSIFVYMLVKSNDFATSVYNFINNTFFKITPKTNTAYLTNYRKNISDYIIKTPDNKIVVFKINADDFYNKTVEERQMIFANFNRFILAMNHPVVFRVLNKKLNLNEYFETIRSNISNNVINEFYFNNFAKSYIDMAKDIPDYNYYMEIFFDKNTSDTQIEQEVNLIFNNMLQYLNISASVAPHLVRGNELIGYLKDIISGVEFANVYDVPIITDY